MTMKDGLKVLHIAVMNAGFPSDFVEMHNRHGDISRLLTFYRNKMGFPEDICLDWKVPKGKLVSKWRKTKELSLGGNSERKAHYFQPHNFAEKIYFDVVDKLREPQVNRLMLSTTISGSIFTAIRDRQKSGKEKGKRLSAATTAAI